MRLFNPRDSFASKVFAQFFGKSERDNYSLES